VYSVVHTFVYTCMHVCIGMKGSVHYTSEIFSRGYSTGVQFSSASASSGVCVCLLSMCVFVCVFEGVT